ncbi:TonB-dependent receptor plug domain-containing protein [Chachezhania antarctica]|uniref:TonB-dependent receptor plug domain-containing protein n=1 Tax=Chachezhania antarctica TaxID=2340860 RepID=UPI00308416E7
MTRASIRPIGITSISILALMAASPAVAQEGDLPGEFLGTILLGQSKREILTDTAVPETIINEEEIQDRQAGTVAELIDSVPGVSLVNGASPSGSGISIRGYGANSVYGTDNKVLIQIDGADSTGEEIYRIGNQLFTDPMLYKQVNVIRGTVGTFEYGSGIIGGVVQLETKDASDFTGGEIGFRLNQTFEGYSNGNGFVTSTIGAWQPTEDLEFLFNYTYRNQSDMTDGAGDTIPGSSADLPSWLAKGKYTFGQDRDQSLTLVLNNTETQELDVPYDTFYTVDFGNVNRTVKKQMTGLRYRYSPIGNDLVDLDVNLTYTDEQIDSSYVWGSYPGNPQFIRDLLDADSHYRTTRLVAKNTSYFSTGAVSHQLRAGVELSNTKRNDFRAGPGGTDQRFAVFAVDEMQIGNLTLTPAVRYEYQNLKGTDVVAPGHTDPYNGQYTNSGPMGGISAFYQFNNGFAVFGSAAYTQGLPPIDDLDNPEYADTAEQSRTYEAGFSYTGGDIFGDGDAVRFKVNAYQTLLWDISTYTTSTVFDLAEVQTEGVEIEGSYVLANGFYTDLNINVPNGTEYDERGNETPWRGRAPQSARLTLGKRIGDTWDLSWELVGAKGLTDRYDDRTPGFGISNVRATWKPQDGGLLEGTQVRFGVENLFDRDFRTALSTLNAPGRNVKLTVSKLF